MKLTRCISPSRYGSTAPCIDSSTPRTVKPRLARVVPSAFKVLEFGGSRRGGRFRRQTGRPTRCRPASTAPRRPVPESQRSAPDVLSGRTEPRRPPGQRPTRAPHDPAAIPARLRRLKLPHGTVQGRLLARSGARRGARSGARRDERFVGHEPNARARGLAARHDNRTGPSGILLVQGRKATDRSGQPFFRRLLGAKAAPGPGPDHCSCCQRDAQPPRKKEACRAVPRKVRPPPDGSQSVSPPTAERIQLFLFYRFCSA